MKTQTPEFNFWQLFLSSILCNFNEFVFKTTGINKTRGRASGEFILPVRQNKSREFIDVYQYIKSSSRRLHGKGN